MASPYNVVQTVVTKDRCCFCGVCAGVCPHKALIMRCVANGDLVPQLTGYCAPSCRLCFDVCPFNTGVYDPRQLDPPPGTSSGISEQPAAFHEDAGHYLSAVVGFSSSHRPASASGGLLTYTLETLLLTGQVDRVAVVAQESGKEGVRFFFKGVSSVEELRSCAGSVYQPVEISAVVREMQKAPELKWAVVGVPCLCAGVRQAATRLPRLRRAVRFVLGMACGMYQNQFYTEALLCRAGLKPHEASRISFRKKTSHGPASNYLFQALDRAGKKSREVVYHGLPLFLGVNACFRCNACNYCKDVFAETADACYMDAWLSAYADDPQGTSLVIIRHPEVRRILEDAEDQSGERVVKPLDIESVVKSQATHVRRKRRLIGMRAGNEKGRLKDRLHWWLQLRFQSRSKKVWAALGRRFGLTAFWLGMVDLLALRWIFSGVIRLMAAFKRVCSNK